jgi:hypothetical protein
MRSNNLAKILIIVWLYDLALAWTIWFVMAFR